MAAQRFLFRDVQYRQTACALALIAVLLVAGVRASADTRIVAAAAPPGTIAPQPVWHRPAAMTAATPGAPPTVAASVHAVMPRDPAVNPQPAAHPVVMQQSMVSPQAAAHPSITQSGMVDAQPPRHSGSAPRFSRGVNLPAPSFNSPEAVPGVLGNDYDYPTAAELDYFKSKGLTLFRVPFAWERMQPTLNGPLDATQLSYMDTLVAAAHARGLQLILDQHNFDRYCLPAMRPGTYATATLVGTSTVPNSAFADFWRRFAAHYASETAVMGYDLTNEPHDTGGRWPTTAQMGANAIRQVDHTHTIIVEGENYAAGSTWTTYNENLAITDPDNNLIYSAHVYFDADGSGEYVNSYDADGAYAAIGVDRVQPFVDWLARHQFRGYVGEYGVPDSDARWLTALDAFLSYLDTNALSGTYWAGGPFIDGYPLSVEPTGGMDRPQMAILARHPGG